MSRHARLACAMTMRNSETSERNRLIIAVGSPMNPETLMPPIVARSVQYDSCDAVDCRGSINRTAALPMTICGFDCLLAAKRQMLRPSQPFSVKKTNGLDASRGDILMPEIEHIAQPLPVLDIMAPAVLHSSPQTRGFRRRFGDRRQYTTENLTGTWRTSRHRHIDRDYCGDATARRIALAEYSTAASTIPDCNDKLRVRSRIVGAAQRHLHILGHRSRYQ